MNDENSIIEDPNIDDEVDRRTESEIEYDRQMDRLDTFFSNLDRGVTLLVQRIQPSWCKGVLEEITIGDDEVNLDYFIENWGGQLLLVKVRADRGRMKGNYRIPLYSYPPMVYGKRLKYNDKSERFSDDSDTPVSNPAPSSPIVVNQPSGMEKLFQILPTILPLFSEMMKANEQRRQADMAMMVQLMKSQNGSGLSDITKVGAVMSQLSEMFRSQNNDLSNSGEMDFMGNALDVIKTVFNNKQEPASQNAHRLTAHKTGSAPGGPPIAPPAKVTPIKSAPTNIAQSISMMGAEEAAETVIEAIGRMPPSKRNDAMGHFIAQYQADMADDDGEYGEDDDYSEESRGGK